MYDDRIPDPRSDVGWDGPARARGGRVRLSWLSRETLVVLLVSGLVALVLSLKLELDEPPRGEPPRLGGHEILLESLTLGAEGNVLISSGWDDTVRFWNLDPNAAEWGEEVLTLPQESHPYTLAPSRDGRYLAVGGVNHMAVWESAGDVWKQASSREGRDGRSLAFGPDSRTLAVGGEAGEVRLLAIPSLDEVAVLDGLTDKVHGIAFSPDGNWLAATSFRGELKLWDWRSGRPHPLPRRIDRVQCFAFTSDGRHIATAPWSGSEGPLEIWDLATGEAKLRIGHEGCNALTFSPDDGLLAAAGVDHSIKVWDVASGELHRSLDKDVGWVKTLLFTAEGTRLVYGGRDGSIRFWDLGEPGRGAAVGVAGPAPSKAKAG